jgi:hypothetical protein
LSNPTATPAPLDDVMLAMDVVDTLRHRQDLVARELDETTREQQLVEKLRDIYHQQGIEVSDLILKEGVAALAESRFVYTPPPKGFGTLLARLYVSRKAWGRGALAFLLVAALGLGGYYLGYKPYVSAQQESARIDLAEGLPQQMQVLYQTIFDETKVQQAAIEAEELLKTGKAAASEGNRAAAETAIRRLTDIRDTLRQQYTLRVVNRPEVKSGFWTFPEINTAATNYYVVVEALDPDGKALSLPILNEENGQTETVALWGLRVPEVVYQSISADKRDDGIIQKNRVGQKQDGFLEPDYYIPVLGGAVTRW